MEEGKSLSEVRGERFRWNRPPRPLPENGECQCKGIKESKYYPNDITAGFRLRGTKLDVDYAHAPVGDLAHIYRFTVTFHWPTQ